MKVQNYTKPKQNKSKKKKDLIYMDWSIDSWVISWVMIHQILDSPPDSNLQRFLIGGVNRSKILGVKSLRDKNGREFLFGG